MPFRKLFGAKVNAILLLVMMCAALAVAMGLIGVLIVLRSQLSQTMVLELIKLIGITVGVATSFAVLLRSTGNAVGIEETQAVVKDMANKANGGHRIVTEIAVKAEREQLITDPLHAAEVAKVLCPLLAKEIAAELRKGEGQAPGQT